MSEKGQNISDLPVFYLQVEFSKSGTIVVQLFNSDKIVVLNPSYYNLAMLAMPGNLTFYRV